MDTLRGLLARDRRSDRPALRVPGDTDHDYRRLLTNAWKTGNFLHHCGVRPGRTVGIAGRRPAAVLAFLGTASLGGVARFDPPTSIDACTVVAPVEEIDDFELPPGGTRVAYGDSPDNSETAHFERDVWSENPTLAPADVAADDPALATAESSLSHAELLAAAERTVERAGLDAGDAVAVRASLTLPGTVAAGLVAPLLAGATVVFPDDETIGDVAITTGSAPEETIIDPTAVR
ncbi:acyl-CoA synthetase family protein [Halococcus agarilyticus]|uniref:AMP-binding protein n=1 Tax=Halococcus agarilyticus TaxID=1232219 RepID=UPI0006776B54|nr:AMP-binding protein [Halococcus agarilyticus]